MTKSKGVESHPFNEGDLVYIVGKYGYGNDYMFRVIEAKVKYKKYGTYFASGLFNCSEWSFLGSDYGKTVFTEKEQAVETMELLNKKL